MAVGPNGTRGIVGLIAMDMMMCVVFEGCKGFDKVGDLLKSSAELLGQGCVGTTFKVLMDGGDDVVVVVKRVVREKLMKLKNKEVDEWLRVIGGVKHSNIVSLRAYHHSSNELRLVYDFLPQGKIGRAHV